MSETIEQIEVKPESESEARNRFTLNYYSRGGKDAAWLAAHIEPLIRIAVPAPRPKLELPVGVKTRPKRHKERKPKEAPLPWGQLIDMFQGQEIDQAEALV